MLTTVETIPLQMGSDGVVRVASTRVTLDSVAQAFAEGATAEEITRQYPSLSLADVYSVIAYLLRHAEEVDKYLSERALQRELTHQRVEAATDAAGIRERLLSRRGRTPS